MIRTSGKIALSVLALSLATSSAFAHPGHEEASGFSHLFSSVDHGLIFWGFGALAAIASVANRGFMVVFGLIMMAAAYMGVSHLPYLAEGNMLFVAEFTLSAAAVFIAAYQTIKLGKLYFSRDDSTEHASENG